MVENLLTLLGQLEVALAGKTTEEVYLSSAHNPLVDAVVKSAERYLITDEGNNDQKNIQILRCHGYNVFPIERDSFGWLIAGISTSVGIISFG